jgi:hypothetical protein
MNFTELNEDNYILFAIKNYENPNSVTEDDFYEDMKRFKWIKRSLKKYKERNELNIHLILNHFIILYNVFNDAATPLLFYQLEPRYWSVAKTIISYLGRMPEYPVTEFHEIQIDQFCYNQLNNL